MILLLASVGLAAYEAPDLPTWQEGDDEWVEVTVREMRLAIWYYEQYHELIRYVGGVEEGRDRLIREKGEILGRLDEEKGMVARLRGRCGVLAGATGASLVGIVVMGVILALR